MAGSQLPKTPLPILLSLGDIPDPGKSVNNGELGRKTVATLSLVAGAVPPPRDPKHSGRGAHCILAISISAFPGKFFSVPTLPSSCCPYPTQGFVLWRPSGLGEGEAKGAGAAKSWVGWADSWGGGGVCCQAPAESRPGRGDRAWLSLLPGVAVLV